jgi:NADPH:quinone reductase-like Zn-dependent oxidoreductase
LIQDVVTPPPAEEEVRIKIEAAGVNPVGSDIYT